MPLERTQPDLCGAQRQGLVDFVQQRVTAAFQPNHPVLLLRWPASDQGSQHPFLLGCLSAPWNLLA